MKEKEGWVYTESRGPVRVILAGDNDEYTCFIQTDDGRALVSKTSVHADARLCAESELCKVAQEVRDAQERVALSVKALRRAETRYTHALSHLQSKVEVAE